MNASAALAQNARFSPAPGASFAPAECQRSILHNGLRVVTERIADAPALAIGILLDGGSQAESPAEHGLTHLCEHLFFQGTSRRNTLQIAQQIDSAGGQVGAFTARDYTCFYAVVLGDYCFHALDLLSDLLLNSIFPPQSIEREQQVIANEIEAAEDDPAGRAQSLVKQALWPGHALGRAIAGTRDGIAAYTREDIILFSHRQCTPDRIVVAAAGDVDHPSFVTQVNDVFWRLLGTGQSASPAMTLGPAGVMFEPAGTRQSYFCVGLPALAYADPQRYTLHVLAKILGGGVSSRLFRELREQRGLVYDIHADYQAYRDAGVLCIEGCSQPEDAGEVLQVTLSELALVADWTRPVTDEELATAKRQLRAEYLISSESTHTRMSRLATQELYFGRPLPAHEVHAAIEQVDRKAIREFSRRLLTASLAQASIAVVGPADQADASDNPNLRRWLDRFWKRRQRKAATPYTDRK